MQIPPIPSQQYRSPEPGDDGSAPVDTAPPAGATPAAGEPTSQGAGSTPTGAGTMLEAMFGQKADAAPSPEETALAASTGKTVQQLRDERGRFAGKAPPVEGQPDPTKPPLDPAAKKPDPNSMPEGLTPKAQERFQQLANTAKELTAKVAEYEPLAASAREMREVFQANGVKREQFDQAMQVVGLMNRGDLRGALQALDQQRALISLHLGEALPGADALAGHPDLRAEVDNLQLTEARAIEIARGRLVDGQRQQAQQRQQQANQQQEQDQQAQERQQQAVRAGQTDVDKFCKARMADDMDYARIEPLLLKEIEGGLLQDVPPARWAYIVEKTYGLIKQSASAARAGGPSSAVLRPTGGESLRTAPKTIHEAMWGGKA